MVKHSLLLVAFSFLMTACGTTAQLSTPFSSLQVGQNEGSQMLNAAEKGDLGKSTIVFFHSDWCHSCDKANPILDQLVKEHSNELTIIRMDIDDTKSRFAVGRYGVSATPTFVLFSAQGNVLASISGWPGKDNLQNTITQMMTHHQEMAIRTKN